MLKRYPNEIVQLLRAAPDLRESDFERTKETTNEGEVFVVRFRDSQMFFRFWAKGDSEQVAFYAQSTRYKVTYQGGYPHSATISVSDRVGAFEFKHVRRAFLAWLENIRNFISVEELIAQERETPDLWGLSGVVALATEAASASGLDSPFEPQEREQVRTTLRLMLAKVQKSNNESQFVTPEQFERLEGKVDQLIEQAQTWKLSKREWLEQAIGLLVAVTFASQFTKDATHTVMSLVAEAFRWMLSGGPALLSPSLPPPPW